MSKLLDPHICPDCRAPLDAEQTCTGCALRLTGPLAVRLWEHMVQADQLIETLRIGPPTGVARPAPQMRSADLPTAPPAPAATTPTRAPSRLSVPAVLLGLGGICVLVAAVVFVAVTWSSLGLAGRTAVLIGVTAVAVAAAAALTRRGLRGGAETLWLVAHVLITIDVVAAAAADLAGLGALDGRHLIGGLGALLLVSALTVAAWATTTAVPRLYGLVAVATAGTLLVTAAEAWTADRASIGTAVSLPLIAAVALLVTRIAAGKLAPQAYAVATVGLVSWLLLVGQGQSRSGSTTASVWWQDLQGWPLLVAALVAAVASLPRPVPEPLRSVAAGAALVCLTLLTLGGTADVQTKVLVGCGVALALAALAGFGHQIWAWPAGLIAGLAALAALPATLLRPFGVTGDLPTTAPPRGAGLDLTFPATSWDLSSWTAPIIAVVAVLCTLALVRFLPDDARPAGRSVWLGAAPVVVGLGLITWFLETEPRLLPAVAAWSALLVLAAALTQRSATDGALVACLALDAYLVGVGLRLAAPSHLLIAVLATGCAAALGYAALRARTDRLEGALVPTLSGAASVLAFFSATHWPYLAGGTGDAAGLTLALVAAATGIAAKQLGRTPAARTTIELSALVCGLAGAAFANDPVVVSTIFTVVGSAVALVSILHRDRDLLSWLGSGILAAAVLVRVENGVAAPELVALPAAALLVAVGIHRMLTDPEASSRRVLSSGLVLGLLPSLLGALEDPVSARGALVAAAGVGFLALGVVRHWEAPFAAGAVVVALISLRHLGPIAAALPRWISLGSVGVALLLVGITWEARRRDATKAERYLTALR